MVFWKQTVGWREKNCKEHLARPSITRAPSVESQWQETPKCTPPNVPPDEECGNTLNLTYLVLKDTQKNIQAGFCHCGFAKLHPND